MPNFPKHIEIETTNMCQLKCPFCPHRLQTREKGFMNWTVLGKIVDEVRGKAKTCYMHQIGEPLLHKDIDLMVNHVSKAGLKTSISTNAMLLDEGISNRLLDSRLDEIILSLDSLEKEKYEKIRAGANFEKVCQNINKMLGLRQKRKESKLFIKLQMIVTKDNVNEVENFKGIYTDKVKNIGELWVKEFSTFAGHVEDMSPKGIQPRRNRCNKLNNSIAISWNGDVVLCCRDYNNFTKVGNILRNSISDIFNSVEYQKLRENMKNNKFEGILDFCKNC